MCIPRIKHQPAQYIKAIVIDGEVGWGVVVVGGGLILKIKAYALGLNTNEVLSKLVNSHITNKSKAWVLTQLVPIFP